MSNIRTEDGVVHLASRVNDDLGQPLCYEATRRLPPRGSAAATDDEPSCPHCRRRATEAADGVPR